MVDQGNQEAGECGLKVLLNVKDVQRALSNSGEICSEPNKSVIQTEITSAPSKDESPSLPHRVELQELDSMSYETRKKEDEVFAISSSKTTPDVTRTKRENRKGSKPKRTGSFASGLQRLMRRDKRRGSLDEREIARLKDVRMSSQLEPGSRTTDLSFLRRAEGGEKRSDSENSTPKLSFEARRHTVFGLKESDVPKNGKRLKKRRFKEFFRAMSFNSVHDVKENRAFRDDDYDCQRASCSQNLSLEFFNAIKDERDHIKHERDRAIEEWTEATSKWELILDEMDALLVELTQVFEMCSDLKKVLNNEHLVLLLLIRFW